LSRRLKVDKELDERTSGDRVFQTRAAAIGQRDVILKYIKQRKNERNNVRTKIVTHLFHGCDNACVP